MSYTKLVQFFATKADLEPGFHAIETKQRLVLAEQNYYAEQRVPTVESLSSIPNLGKVTERRSPRYVVQRAGEKFAPARVVQVGKKKDCPPKLAMALALTGIRPPGGKVVFDIQLGKHSSAISFAAGGFWNPQTLVAGEIATIHDTPASMELYKLFCKELLRGFTSVQSFEVGPEALAFLKSGGRLTIDVQVAPMLDLVFGQAGEPCSPLRPPAPMPPILSPHSPQHFHQRSSLPHTQHLDPNQRGVTMYPALPKPALKTR